MKNKNIQFPNHTEIQMNERNIDKLMVLETLKNPLQIFSSKNNKSSLKSWCKFNLIVINTFFLLLVLMSVARQHQ